MSDSGRSERRPSRERHLGLLVAAAPLFASALAAQPPAETPKMLHEPREARLAGVRQLTFGGENAEAYWGEDGHHLILQSTRPPYACDQIFTLDVDTPGAGPKLVSTGKGKTTCSYLFPDGKEILYASTHAAGDACPPPPDRSHGYVWSIDSSYEIYKAAADGSAPAAVTALTANAAYDAEATVCPVDSSIVFTSTRDGDLDLYRMDRDGGNVKRLTATPGYDGGAFFSRDCKQIVWRASRPQGAELDDFRALLAKHLVRPGRLELWVADVVPEGIANARQITALGAASFAPYFYPDGKRVIFSSNYGDPKGREFDLWAVDVDGTDLERITYTPGFDGFPMFSPDGKRLAFASNRNQGKPGETDVYLADWVAGPPAAAATPSAADRFERDADWLADDAREGRGVGTAGLQASAAEIERRFRELGLEPAGVDGTYRQPFEVTVALTSTAATALALDGETVAADAFRPLAFSKSATVEGDVVFAGYGITSDDPARDDYKGLDVAGKIVAVRRFVPAGFAGSAERRYSDLRYKAFNARDHGAIALLVVDLPEPVEGQPIPDEATLPRLNAEDAGESGIVVASLKRANGEKLFEGAHRAKLTVELVDERKPAENVIGRLQGAKAAPGSRTVLVGAHYDHLGKGGSTSLAPGVEEIHNGADDNASGVAALLEAATELAARRADLPGDVLFAAFSGEERGLLGSTAYTRNPPAGVELAKLGAMINMDMVGRLRENKLALLGGGSATEWPEMATAICSAHGVDCSISGDGYGPSDQTAFYAAGVPVLHLFTGTHDDYHKPSDDSSKLNALGGATVAAIAADLAEGVLARTAPLTYASAPQPAPAGDARSFGASLGTIPDYAGPAKGLTGVLLAGVRPGGPAEKAGLQRGDRLVGLADKEIRDIHDMMFVLRSVHPGDKAIAVVMRGEERLELPVVFGESRRM